MTERVSVIDYPDYDKRERRRIYFLLDNIEYLEGLTSYAGRKKTLIEALKYGIEMLGDHSMEPMSAEHLIRLRERRDWYRSSRDKNGFQLQEMGALSWLIEEIESYEKEE